MAATTGKIGRAMAAAGQHSIRGKTHRELEDLARRRLDDAIGSPISPEFDLIFLAYLSEEIGRRRRNIQAKIRRQNARTT